MGSFILTFLRGLKTGSVEEPKAFLLLIYISNYGLTLNLLKLKECQGFPFLKIKKSLKGHPRALSKGSLRKPQRYSILQVEVSLLLAH
jgi:hypothetical protein